MTEKIKKDQDKVILYIYNTFLKKYKIMTVSIIILVLFAIMIETTYLPNLYSAIPESYSEIKNIKFTSFFKNIKNKNSFSQIIVLIFMSWLLITFSKYVVDSIDSKLKPAIYHHIKDIVVKELFKNKEKDIDNGEYISRINRLVDDITLFFQDGIEVVLPLILETLVMNFYFYFIDIKFGLIMTICVILSLIIGYFQSIAIFKNAEDESNEYHNKTKNINDVLSNMENILVNNQTEKYMKKIDTYQQKYNKTVETGVLIRRDTCFYTTSLTIFLISVILYISYNKVKISKISGAQMGALVIILIFYNETIYKLALRYPRYLMEYGKIKDSLKYFDINDTISTYKKINYATVDPNNHTISFKNVTIMRGDKKIYHNFNLTIPHLQKLGIYGKSGRGKSTLLKSIIGITHPTSGTIQISNKNILDHDFVELRDKVIFIGQDTVILNQSIINNMMEGNNATKQQIINLLHKYDLNESFVNGIETMVTLNGSNLSKGMQKIIFIIRGLLRKGYIYLIDEPTTSLDHETKTKIIKMINDMCRDKTLICISHDPDIKKIMDKNIEL